MRTITAAITVAALAPLDAAPAHAAGKVGRSPEHIGRSGLGRAPAPGCRSRLFPCQG